MATIRKDDGFGRTTPHLRGEVERLQRALVELGYETDTDGLFGSGTERLVKQFQRSADLQPDGVVGPATWRALERRQRRRARRPAWARVPGFESFHGDLEWVHAREGHAGTAYWPGGESGVSLDPGFDLGYQTPERIRELYGPLFGASELDALTSVSGLKGDVAKAKLRADPTLRGLRVTRAQAAKIMPHVAVTYWTAIVDRFSRLADEETPGSVQTALLSLAYNRGPRNSGLRVLGAPIRSGDWMQIAERLGAMQQSHRLRGIRIRRRQEADLIREEVDFA